jgi:hypothetical protein
LQAFIRSGCVHLTYEAIHPSGSQPKDPDWARLAEVLGRQLLADRTVLVQQGAGAALFSPGQEQREWAWREPGGPAVVTAQLRRVAPCCVAAGSAAQLQLLGEGIDDPAVVLHARCQGHFLQLERTQQQAQQQQAGSAQVLQVQLPALEAPGRVSLELEQACLLGEALTLLVVPGDAMAAEVVRLEQQLPQQLVAQVGLRAAGRGCGCVLGVRWVGWVGGTQCPPVCASTAYGLQACWLACGLLRGAACNSCTLC